MNLASVVGNVQAISVACSQRLSTCLNHYLPPSTAAVVRCALYTWSTSFSCSLYFFPVSVLYKAPSVVFLYSHPTHSAPYKCASLQVLLCASIRSLDSHSFHFQKTTSNVSELLHVLIFEVLPSKTGYLKLLGDIFPWFIFIIFLLWCLGIWVCDDNRSRYLSLDLSCLGGNFIPEILFAVCIFRECWQSVAPFPDLFGGYVQ